MNENEPKKIIVKARDHNGNSFIVGEYWDNEIIRDDNTDQIIIRDVIRIDNDDCWFLDVIEEPTIPTINSSLKTKWHNNEYRMSDSERQQMKKVVDHILFP